MHTYSNIVRHSEYVVKGSHEANCAPELQEHSMRSDASRQEQISEVSAEQGLSDTSDHSHVYHILKC